jgi:hypothetical protein
MNARVPGPLLGAFAFLCSITITTAPARADVMVNGIVGQYGGVDPLNGFQLPSFTLIQGTVSAPPILMGDNADPLPVDVTQYGVDGGTDVTLSPTFNISEPFEGGGSATWDISNPATLFPNEPQIGFGTITADLTLSSNSISGVDLSALSTATLTVSFFGIQVVGASDGVATWPFPNPDSAVGATFTITPRNVPEPGSLAAWFLVGLTGAGWLWSRRRRRAA